MTRLALTVPAAPKQTRFNSRKKRLGEGSPAAFCVAVDRPAVSPELTGDRAVRDVVDVAAA